MGTLHFRKYDTLTSYPMGSRGSFLGAKQQESEADL
jgi:hypothetical protein